MSDVAERIEQVCDADPPEDVDGHLDLFTDYDDDRVGDALFKLWQKGILEAEWDDDDQATVTWLTEFGDELHQRGLAESYINAVETDFELDDTPAVREVPLQ